MWSTVVALLESDTPEGTRCPMCQLWMTRGTLMLLQLEKAYNDFGEFAQAWYLVKEARHQRQYVQLL